MHRGKVVHIKNAADLNASWQEKFQGLIGRKATYYTHDDGVRTVKIVEATPYFVRMTYRPRTKMHNVRMSVCANYLALACGEEKIQVREEITEVVELAVVSLAG